MKKHLPKNRKEVYDIYGYYETTRKNFIIR